MNIGFIGSGEIGFCLAAKLIKLGHSVARETGAEAATGVIRPVRSAVKGYLGKKRFLFLTNQLFVMNTTTDITGIAPFFILKSVSRRAEFYHDQLGFDITFQGPGENDIFFGIVQRGAAMIILKSVGVDPVPNYTRDITKGIARWDAYLQVPAPDALAAAYASRQVSFFTSIAANEGGDDGLRGFEVADKDGYILFFGRTER